MERVVVIGGSSGMGLATARAAAQQGARVTIAGRTADRLAKALATLPDGCTAISADTADEAAVAALFEQVGEFDHLIYTAAEFPGPRPLAEIPPAEARALFDRQFGGLLAAVHHAIPRIRPGGSIALTSGVISVRPLPGTALLAAGAAAVEGLARGLALELAPIRVNVVRPGPVRTPMWDAIPAEHREAMFAASAQRTLAGTVGEAEQIAATFQYLMNNPFVTGTVLTVDGGALLV
jgi:NAD(P)-dependent dehydrogenase (short-subunit alcohol dehydrogenase family)